MARDDDELAALSDEFERTDPRLAGSLARFRPSRRPLVWVLVGPPLAAGLAAAGWWLDPRVVAAVAILLILGTPLLVALAVPRSTPRGGISR